MTDSHRLRFKGLINPEQTATLLCAKRAGESDRSGIISGSENSNFADLSQSQRGEDSIVLHPTIA